MDKKQLNNCWILRDGDLHAEMIGDHTNYSSRFLERLEQDHMIFQSRDDAEAARSLFVSILAYVNNVRKNNI